MKLTGAQILWEALVREGVTDVFGYPGGAILPAYDAMLQYPIRHILVRHEQGATHMADGYARASGKVGVAIATSGPGATNMVTGIATAMMDSSPIVCITGQVGSKLIGSDAFQETDITGITLPITKHNYLVTRAEDVAPAVCEAFAVARSRAVPGRCSWTSPRTRSRAAARWTGTPPSRTSPRRTTRRCRATATARRDRADQRRRAAADPRRPRRHAVGRRARRCSRSPSAPQIPIAVTLLGIGGVAASHPLNLGMMGMHGEAWVNHAIQEADLLIALGMRFDDRVTGNLKTYARNAKKIHVDIDRAELNKNVRVDVGDRQGSARRRSTSGCRTSRRATASAWLGAHRRDQGRHAPSATSRICPTTAICTRRTSSTTSGASPTATRVVVTDVGQHQMWEAQYYKHDRSRSLITSGGLGTMGFALPAAIGAKIACPDAEVWVVVGDGGFQMTMPRAGDDRAGGPRRQRRDHQQRLPRHGPAVAGVLLREALRGDAARSGPTSRSSPRRSASTATTVTKRAEVADAVQARATTAARRADRFPGRAGRLGLPDGAGRRRPAQDDPAAVADRRNGGGLRTTTHEATKARSSTKTSVLIFVFVVPSWLQ